MIALIFKVKPIEKIALITDSICASGYADGDYELGGLEVKVEKGVASLVSRDALAGSTLRYNRGLQNVWEITGIPLKELVKTTSFNQAKALGLPRTGKIEKGYVADIVLTDRDFNVKAVFIEGEQRI
jgi:N-acetylglucosamine-6-phosphate deacetylase